MGQRAFPCRRLHLICLCPPMYRWGKPWVRFRASLAVWECWESVRCIWEPGIVLGLLMIFRAIRGALYVNAL